MDEDFKKPNGYKSINSSSIKDNKKYEKEESNLQTKMENLSLENQNVEKFKIFC